MLRLARCLVPALLVACTETEPVARAPAPEPASPMGMTRAGAPPSAEPAMAPPGAASGDLASPSARVREAGVIDYEGDLAALAPLASRDESAAVRLAAVQRLADGETPVARAALRRALEDDDADVLAEAILAVTALQDRKAAPALRRLREHPDEEVRALAEDALFALAP